MNFDLAGARSAGYSDGDIVDYLSQQRGFNAAAARQAGYNDSEILNFLNPAQAQPQVAPGSGSSLLSGAYGLGGNLASAAEGVGRITGIERLERLGREGRIRAEQAAEEALPESERMSFGQAEGVRQNLRAAGQALGSSLPSAAPGLAGALGGAALGTAILPGPGSIIGGVVGGAAATIPQFFGANRQRQIQETGEVQSEGRALAAALPQAVSEGVVDRLTLGLGRVLGVGGETVAREVLPRIATGIGVGAVTNVPAEVFQQAIERAQAGLDVLGPEAMSEYREAATAAAVVGGTMGGTIAGAFGPRPAPPPGDDRPELQQAIQDIVAAREPEPTLAIGSDPVIETPVGDMRQSDFLRYMERRLPEMAATDPKTASLLEYTRNQPEAERIQLFRDLLDQEQQRLVDARQRSEEALIASAPPEFQAVPIEDLPTRADGGPLSKTEFEALRVRERATKPVTLEDLEARDLAEARGTPEGQSVEQLIKDFKRNKAKPVGQKSLTQFIVEQGGIRDERGEVRNMLGNNIRSRPGLISNKGLPLDRMAEAAREAGYFDDMRQAGLFVDEGRAWQAGENIDPLDARAFMNALEEDFSGRNRRFGRTEDIAGREKQEALADLDEYLRAQGIDIDAPLPDILRALRRQNPDAPSLSLDELIEADKAYAWYQDAVAAKKAKRGRPAAPVEAPAVAAEEVQPGQPTGPQGSFSARTPAGAAQTQAQTQAEQPTEQADPNQEKARQLVNEYLSELKAEGRQGRLIAKDLETLLNDRQFDANQIYQAFIVAKTLTKTMPNNADYRLKFLPDLVVSKRQAEAAKASGAKAGDRAQAYIEYPTESLPGFINISLAQDMLPYLRETAAHEAFHVLQTYFGQYDKTFADRIKKLFRNDMTIADLEPSIKRRLMALKPPGSKQSYYDSLVEGLGDRKLYASEAQAYAFGSLIDAMNRGQRVTALIPSFQRFTTFARNFFNTMKRALTGDGFTSPADILTQAQQRGRVMEQAAPVGVGQELSVRRVPAVAGLAPFGQRVPAATPQSINQADLVVQYDVASRYLSKKLGRFIEPPKVERFFMSFQDKMLPVGRMIDDVRKAGGNVPVAMDAYLKEDLLQGKIATMLEDRNKALYSKLTESLSKSSISLEDFENYLYARHAPERNAYIASINPDMPDGGSGLSNRQADDFMADFKQKGKLPRMQELARLFDQIIADTNKLRVESGLNPDFSTMKVTSDGNPVPNYRSYVPLRGFAEESPDGDETITEFRTGRALGAKGREDKKALGRERKAGDLLAHAIMQNTQAVIRSETNKVGQSFLDMIRANPDQTSSLAEVISSTPMRRALVNGTVKMVPDLTYKNQPDVLVVKEGGNEVAIRIKDENVARALTGASALSPNSKNLLVQGMALVNRYLAKINTAWNPEFLITNFVRDLQTFGVNVQQFDLDGITRDSLRDVKAAMSGVRDSVRGSNNNPLMRQAYERFKQIGGTTELYGFSDLDSRIAEINQVMSGIGNQAKSWKDMAKAVTPVIKFIEDYNTVVENGIRTSLFKNLVDRGIDEERAAQIAKNVTVNFSKGGENRVLMNSLYLFYNAALQGSMAMVNAIGRSAKVRKIVGGIVVAGVLQDAINSMLSDVGDDDEAIYDKIPDHILKRSFVMMDPFGITERGYFSFPMPYGFNAFYNMGREMSKAGRGKSDPMKAAGNIVGTFVDAFNPIGGTESFLNFVAPTILDPAVDIATNTDFTGRPIVPERGGFGVQPPESQKYWNNTFAPYVDIASFLNEITGGTPVIPGKVDISPALIQYVVNYATGGVGKFVERSFTTATTTIPGLLRGDLEEMDVKNIPFLRSLYGNVTSREDMSVYTERMNEVLQVRQEIRQAAQAGMPERVQVAMEKYPGQVQIMDAFNSLSRDRMQISRQINEINRNANIPDDAKKDIIKSLRDQQNMLVQMANRLYIQNVERR